MSVDIDLAVQKSADGKWIRERIPARVPDSETYELANSPMLVRGLAADDHIRLLNDGQFELLRWGRNIAVQVFGEWGEVDALAQHIASIGGRLDGKEPRMRVFTIPLSTGIHKIETTIDDVVSSWPNLSWMFGNLTEIGLLAGHDAAGEPLLEHVQAFEYPDGSFEILTSPLLVAGAASGDFLRLESNGSFEVSTRGGNTAVQAFGDWELDFLTPSVVEIGGRLDGDADGQVASFTFPRAVERAKITALFDAAPASTGERSWRFGNEESS